MRLISAIDKKWLILFIFNATVLGISLDVLIGNKIDYWIHDSALVFQARTEWKYTGLVVLDRGVPIQVSRIQALPLYARAVEQLVAAGAKGIFLDAQITKSYEAVMPYATCIEPNGEVQWSQPGCSYSDNQCALTNSPAGNAPLKMSGNVFQYFRIAPYLEDQASLPDFLLYDAESEEFIPPMGLVALDRLVTKETPIGRWLDMSPQHASVTMANLYDPQRTEQALKAKSHEVCDQDIPCQRVRFSYPVFTIQLSPKQPVVPVSQLASCDPAIASEAANLLKGRVVILQLTTPNESTDTHITPITTAFFGPHLITPGPQYLVDSIETLLNADHPREPDRIIKQLLILLVAILGVFAGAFLKQFSWIWGIGSVWLLAISALCFLMPTLQLWPVTVTVLTFITAALQSIALHLLIGLKQGHLILQYMPKQVHNMLLSLKTNELFSNQRYQAVVLMSDLAGYTTVTGLLKEPMHILNLMNDYLDQTTFVLQDNYDGWLETYIGDMVCYYWPYKIENVTTTYEKALLGALELSKLQKRFFSELMERYKNLFDTTLLQNMQQIMNAGIGLSSGTVVMGDLGPKRGVRKFGILGDPMNLTSRIESLTRHFNTEIIITADFLTMTQQLAIPTRRLGQFCVKGRDEPALLYALGSPDDPRFDRAVIEQWENWLIELESGAHPLPDQCPSIFQKDQTTLMKWYSRDLLRKGVWYLEEK